MRAMNAGSFKRVGLVARTGSQGIVDSLQAVAEFLAGRAVDVILEDTAASMLSEGVAAVMSGSAARGQTEICSREEMGERCDLVIAVGGDGNILGAARTLVNQGVPILGINRGRLGFLADVHPDDIETQVGAVLDGEYTVEEHFLLEGWVENGRKEPVLSALNEVVIHSASLPRMLDFDLYINNTFVYNQYSDGCIISTPTGSTAYSLSAGGPIMSPSLDAIVLVPMFPHTLNSRSLVVGGDSLIRIELGHQTSSAARVSFDSHNEYEIEPGQSLMVRKKKEKLKLVHPPGHSFFSVCRSKLDWATRVGE